jgi:hypothetical protein
MEIKEIEQYVKHVTDRNQKRIQHQLTDQSFYDDTFDLPIVENEKYIIKTGFTSRVINGVTQQLIAYLPKVYTEARIKTLQERADNVARISNDWVKKLSRQSVNPFRETFKKLIGTRGEAWIYVPHKEELSKNSGWREEFGDVIPVYFILQDPMIVFHDPVEEIDGRPQRVVLKYKRLVSDILTHYPNWTKGQGKQLNEEVDFWYYIDKDTRYAEADGEALFRDISGEYSNGDGRLSNIYGVVPFVHKYSGYGVETHKKEPSDLAYSRTRMLRGLIQEDCSMASDFRYNIHEFAWKIKTIFAPENWEQPPDFLTQYRNNVNSLNIMKLPQGSEMKVEETQAFGEEAYAYRDRVRADLNAEYPLPMRGVASGTSGRQEDILSNAGVSMYDSPLEANAQLWAEALDLAFKICSNETLDILPEGLRKDDYKSYSDLTVDIKKTDPNDLSRKAAEGDRRFEMGIIDLETLYVDYMGKTKEEAQKLKAKVWIEQAMRTSPAFMQLIIQTAAEEMGKEEQLAQIEAQMQGGANMNPPDRSGAKGGEPRTGNIKTPEGMEMAGSLATRREGRLPPSG